MSAPNRQHNGRPAAPVRILHLGMGNFARAHLAWYTEHAPDAEQWGIAGFSGRGGSATPQSRYEALSRQDGVYLLDIRHPDQDQVEVISSVSTFHDGTDMVEWLRLFADPQVAIVSSTVTEVGYCVGADGGLDLGNAELVRELDSLRVHLDEPPAGGYRTAPGKLILGLLARRARHAGPVTMMPCDNVPQNGPMVSRIVREAAQYVDPSLVDWLDGNVSFVTTVVDRITPHTTPGDIERVAAVTGLRDDALVVAEPFAEWVLSGEFQAGRPGWEAMGARFVRDIVPFESRKLFLLNGSHSLMAYAGSALGYQTIYEAVGDPRIVTWIHDWWDEAVTQIPLPDAELQAYEASLMERYRNPQIRHLLTQIAADGSAKIPIRIVPTIRAFLADGRIATGATRVLAAWLVHLRGIGAPVEDPRSAELTALVRGPLDQAADALVAYLGIASAEVSATVARQAEEILAQAR